MNLFSFRSLTSLSTILISGSSKFGFSGLSFFENESHFPVSLCGVILDCVLDVGYYVVETLEPVTLLRWVFFFPSFSPSLPSLPPSFLPSLSSSLLP